jgi:DNA-binding response OmpR family regulator
MAEVKEVNILVVDDDVTVLQKVEKVLKKSGYEVEVATDGALAINRALASLPDIVVSAVEMPLLDGFKLCQLLRTNPISRDIPFVFLTSKETVPQRLGKHLRPFDEFLLKPFKESDLVSRVKGLLDRLEKVEEAGGEEQKALLGTLTEITLMDLLQIMRLNRRSGSLDLEQDGRLGTVYLREGEVISAKMGKYKGEKAFYRLLTWDKGKFEFHPQTIDMEVLIERPGENLILEGLRQTDEIAKLRDGFSAKGERLELIKRFQGPPEKLKPVTREVLKLLEYFSSVEDLLDQSLFNDLEICQTIQTLIDRKIVGFGAAAEEGPAEAETAIISMEDALKLSYQLGVGREEASHASTGKVLIFSSERAVLQALLEGLSRLKQFKIEAGVVLEPGAESIPLGAVGSITVLEGTELSMYSFPSDPSYRSLWEPLSQGTVGNIILTKKAGAEKDTALFCDQLLHRPFVLSGPDVPGEKEKVAADWDWVPSVSWAAIPLVSGKVDSCRDIFATLFSLILKH